MYPRKNGPIVCANLLYARSESSGHRKYPNKQDQGKLNFSKTIHRRPQKTTEITGYIFTQSRVYECMWQVIEK